MPGERQAGTHEGGQSEGDSCSSSALSGREDWEDHEGQGSLLLPVTDLVLNVRLHEVWDGCSCLLVAVPKCAAQK